MTEEISIPQVVGVRFAKVGKVYHFSASHIGDIQVGDQVVVETSRGWQLGTVSQVLPQGQFHQEGMKAIDRRATPRDLLLRQSWQAKEAEVLSACRSRAEELRLNGIKIIHSEYSFDGTRLSILFSTETEDKYDLKSLRQDMQRQYQPAVVEMRQIGPRDVAKLLGGMGACGLESRCCSQFLCEFSSISIRMAKEQGISLTPTEITGMCGRLRCCLIYEYEQYTDARALLPKKNRRVMTPAGEARVLDQIPMRDAVYVVLMDDTRREFKRSEIQLIDENGILTPAMSDEEREALHEEPAPVEAEVEEETPAAYTLPPQRAPENPHRSQGQSQQSGRRPEGDRGQGRGQAGFTPRTAGQDSRSSGQGPRQQGGGSRQAETRPARSVTDSGSADAGPEDAGSDVSAPRAPQQWQGRRDFKRNRPGGSGGNRPGGNQGNRPGPQGGRQGSGQEQNRAGGPQGQRPGGPQGGRPSNEQRRNRPEGPQSNRSGGDRPNRPPRDKDQSGESNGT